mmetsp:Transcript_18808/g.34251  ORF Transcript_18808/g.34251 Transcript_18808/m.34251 type:complete len:265 (-) Transcript_18808:878-1672(-)
MLLSIVNMLVGCTAIRSPQCSQRVHIAASLSHIPLVSMGLSSAGFVNMRPPSPTVSRDCTTSQSFENLSVLPLKLCAAFFAMYFTDPRWTKYILLQASPQVKTQSPPRKAWSSIASWQSWRTRRGNEADKSARNMCPWRSGDLISWSRSFCNSSGNVSKAFATASSILSCTFAPLRYFLTRSDNVGEIRFSWRNLRRTLCCVYFSLCRLCSSSMVFERVLMKDENTMMARSSTMTAKKRSSKLTGEMSIEPVNCASDQWTDVKY